MRSRGWFTLFVALLLTGARPQFAGAQSMGGELGTDRQRAAAARGDKTEEEVSAGNPETPTVTEILKNPPPTLQAGAVDPARYLLGPGDLLQLDLWGRLVRSVALEVSPEGKIFMPGFGPLDVSGRTLEWARQRALDVVSRTFRGVSGDLRLVRLRSFKLYVAGSVARPGAIEVTSVTRASEALGRIGLSNVASRRNIQLRHLDGSKERVDLQVFEVTGSHELDPMLRDGDVLVIPAAKEHVDMHGAVVSPGRYDLVPGDSLSGLIRLAGGMVNGVALDRGMLLRFSAPTQMESVVVDLSAVLADRFDFALQDGDAFFAGFSPEFHVLPTVEIYGEVERPGSFPIRIGKDRLSDLVREAGGFRQRANQKAILVVRSADAPKEEDPEMDRLARLSRDQMTDSEYATLQTKLAQRKGSFLVDWAQIRTPEGAKDVDPLLRNGDLIRVEPLVTSVRVQGEVRHPGVVEYVPGRTPSEYINLAGGFTDRAAGRQVRLSRSQTGQVIPVRSVKNVEPGDLIWVPEKRDVNFWLVFRDLLTVAGQVAVIIVAVRR